MGRKAGGRLSASRFGESRVCGIMPPAWDGSENEVEREKTVIKWEAWGERDTDAHPTESWEGGSIPRWGTGRNACFPSRFSAGFQRPSLPGDSLDPADGSGFEGCLPVLDLL